MPGNYCYYIWEIITRLQNDGHSQVVNRQNDYGDKIERLRLVKIHSRIIYHILAQV